MGFLSSDNESKAQAYSVEDRERQRYGGRTLAAQNQVYDPAYAAALNNALTGQGPSVADQFARNAGDQAQANANAMAASSRGDVNPALLQRNAMNAAALGQQQANQQGAMMKSQEFLNALQLAGNKRAQDVSNLQFYEQLGLQGDMQNLNSANGAQAQNLQIAGQNAAGRNQMTGEVIKAAASGAALAASDERVKKNVQSGDSSIQDFLDAISAKKYSYKDPEKPGRGEGEFVSPMAQDLEESEVGKSMVKDTPTGKMVDYGKGFGAVLAAQAMLNERMKKLEKKNG